MRQPSRAMCIFHMVGGPDVFSLDEIRAYYWTKDREHFETMHI